MSFDFESVSFTMIFFYDGGVLLFSSNLIFLLISEGPCHTLHTMRGNGTKKKSYPRECVGKVSNIVSLYVQYMELQE